GGFRDDGGVAFGAGGDHAELVWQEVADEAEIVEGGFGKLGRIFYAVSVLAPAGERFIFGDDVLVLFREGGHFVQGLAFVSVSGADLNFALGVEDVDLGDNKRVYSVNHFGVAKDGQVEPAAAARASCDCAKFLAAFADFLRFEVRHFGRKGTAADTRRISF